MQVLSLDRFIRAAQSPKLIFREMNRIYHTRFYMRKFNPSGINVTKQDWDNLLILDGCRYDLFDSISNFDVRTESRISRGSSTVEWLSGNMQGQKMHDTVYITANPQLSNHNDRLNIQFHAHIDVWRQEGWNSKNRTVLPETVTEYAVDAHHQYPHKRLLVHYIQPHYPFIGPTGQEHFPNEKLNFWQDLFTGNESYDRKVIWKAYKENLRQVLPSVQDAVNKLDGLSIVSSDHGQIFGEPASPVPVPEYGHPHGIYTNKLVKIPWVKFDSDNRRDVEESSPVNTSSDNKCSNITDRLEHLGYV